MLDTAPLNADRRPIGSGLMAISIIWMVMNTAG